MLKKEYNIDTKHGTYKAQIWRDAKEKVYLVQIPAFPELATFGASLADAKRMAKDIIQLHCGCLIEEGGDTSSHCRTAQLTATTLAYAFNPAASQTIFERIP